MKKNIFICSIISIMMLLTIKVNAKVVSKDEIENDSYIIGNYLFTRDKNTENNYNGKLTTKVMLLAAKSLDGGLDDMQVFYKTFLGDWIDGITGQSITPPNYFEIENRNLRDIIPTPDLDCSFDFLYSHDEIDEYKVTCSSSAVIDKTLNYASNDSAPIYNNLEKIDGREFYVLRNSDGTLPSNIATFNPTTAQFETGNTTLVPVKVCDSNSSSTDDCMRICNISGSNTSCNYNYSYAFDSGADHPFYQIVSRLYYLDGEKKVYSEYSNIQTNGYIAKLMTSISPNSTINNNYGIKVDSSLGSFGSGLNGEVNYYNVKFNLGHINTEKYMIREYRVYSPVKAMSGSISPEHFADYQNAEGGSDTLQYLYFESLANSKYTKPHRLAFGTQNVYLIADISGINGYGNYADMSSKEAFSKLLFWESDMSNTDKREFIVKATVCNLDQTECYEVKSSKKYIGL